MTVVKNCGYIFFVFAFAFYIAAYSPWSSSLNFDYRVLVDTKSNNNNNTPTIKIVLWTGSMRNAKGNHFKKARLARFKQLVSKMNREKNEVCKAIRMDEKDVNSLEDDDDGPGHCEYLMSSTNEMVADGDAIAFFMFTDGYKLTELPKLEGRNLEQIWVMYSREPPPLSKWRDPLRSLFNWTMSYRRDSDIWTPYGKFVQRSNNTIEMKDLKFLGNVSMEQWISGKSKLITGVISNCHTDSLREKLISQLRKTGVQVDLYGACGQPTCGRYSNKCGDYWKSLAKQYKFYMAFENSLCKDYITEKFWRALDLGMVPVVYGGGNYDQEAPQGSYINVRDFSSAENLMKYLQYLNSNSTEYGRYFEWRRKFKLQKDWDSFIVDWCYLCKAVKRHKREGFLKRQTYDNLYSWWKHDGQQPLNKSACSSKPKKFFLK